MFKPFALLTLLALPAAAALASTPATHAVTLSATVGNVTVVEWTGTALPGGTGQGSTGGLVGQLAGVDGTFIGCPPQGADDSHAVTFTVPAKLYDSVNVAADFHIEWTKGTTIDGVGTDPELALSLYNGTTSLGNSDGGEPQENVRIVNPAAGTVTAVVCPYLASKTTPYKATLTLTTTAKAACISSAPTGKALAHSTLLSEGTRSLIDVESGTLLNFDRFLDTAPAALAEVPDGFEGRHLAPLFDRALGVTTFLWAKTDAKPVAVGALPEREQMIARARAQLTAEAATLKLTPAMIADATVMDAQYNGDGPAVVRFNQQVNGREVFGRTLNVMLDRNGKPIAVSGYFATDFGSANAVPAFSRSGADAIALAWKSLGGVSLGNTALVPSRVQDEWQWYAAPVVPAKSSHVFEREPRAKAGYYALHGRLEPAYYVEIFAVARANRSLSAYALTVSAVDGSILARDNLKASADVAPGTTSAPWKYRVYADVAAPYQLFDNPLGNSYTPYPAATPGTAVARVGSPGSPNLVSLSYGPISTKDAWLPDTATQTTGNNATACLDKFDPANSTLSTPYNTCDDALSASQGDFFAKPSSDHSFDYTALPDKDPSTTAAKNASVVGLFYLNNWLHDWWYDHGFNEAAKNGQTNNYGRGGAAADPVKAQAQDGSGRNNANMATPSDGSSPTMQQYLFDGPLLGEVRVLKPADSGQLAWRSFANIGPTTYNIPETGIVLANDGVGDSMTDGCAATTSAVPASVPVPAPPQTSLMGKIALIDRGNCATTSKEQFAQNSGAVAMIVINNADGDPPSNIGNLDVPMGVVAPTNVAYTIPGIIIRRDAGLKIKEQLKAGAVTGRLSRQASIDVDGTLDNQIVGHEFFHYVHHRLTSSSNQQADAMSEGWGDVNALMISVRPDDITAPNNDKWQGAYGLAGYSINNFYAGIRRAPYSTSKQFNAFTLKHIADGTVTPDGGPGTTNSEVHAAGEMWANEMWNCYAGILNTANNGSFLEKQTRMKNYIIAGFKMTPTNATYTEARDAILAPVLATNFTDYKACSDGFAVTGNGLNAVAPARSSTTLTGVVENFEPFVCKSSTTPTDPTPTNPTPVTPINPAPAGSASGVGEGRFGGGSLPLLLLLPFAGLALLRRKARA